MIAFSARCGSKGPFRCAARLWVSINERRVESFCSAAAVCGRFGGSSGRDPVLGGADALGAGALELWLRRGRRVGAGCRMGDLLGLAPLRCPKQPDPDPVGWNCRNWAGAVADRAHGKSMGDLECGAAMGGVFDGVFLGFADRRFAGCFAAFPAGVALFWVRDQRDGGAAVLHIAGQGVLDISVGILRRCLWTVCKPDRKSTRLNSSHLGISYAVFCL